MKKLFIIVLLFSSFSAWAYIPSSAFVFDRVSALHGKGAYKITADVLFKENAEQQLIKETWLVIDGGEMMVQAVGEGFKISRALKKGKVRWLDQNNSEHQADMSTDYFMSPLLIRTPLELKKHFVRWGALPTDSLREKNIPKDIKLIKTETENFVRLGRVNGAIQLVYSKDLDHGAGLWIEQDHFFITKMRAPSEAEFLGQDYVIYSRSLALPRTQTISFSGKKVEIKITSVQALDGQVDSKKYVDYSATTWPQNSLANTIQEFYKRFR